LGQRLQRDNQTAEKGPKKSVLERALDQQSISRPTHSRQGAMEADCPSAVTPLFINNGE
jgi:hypothetical protein